MNLVAHALRGEGFDASEDGTGRGTPLVPMFLHTNKGRPDGRRSAHTEMVSVKDIVETLTTDGHAQSAVAVPVAYGIRTANTSSNSPPPALLTAMQVRRLLPEECEKLQGFEPGYTAIPWRGKPADQCPDGPRYKALGNSWAVNCARWIGERIEAVEAA